MFQPYFCHNDKILKKSIPTLACLSIKKIFDEYNIQESFEIISKYCGSPEDFNYAKKEFFQITRQNMISNIFHNFQDFCLFYKKLCDHDHEIKIGKVKHLNPNIFNDFMNKYNLKNEDLIFLADEIMSNTDHNYSCVKCYGQYYRNLLSGDDNECIDFICETEIILKVLQHHFIPFKIEYSRTEKSNYNFINIYKVTDNKYPEIFIYLSLTSYIVNESIDVNLLFCDMINGGSVEYLYSNNQYLDKLQMIENCKNKKFFVLTPECKPIIFHGEYMEIIRDEKNKITHIKNNISPYCDVGNPEYRPYCTNCNSNSGKYILSQINDLYLQGWECINEPCTNLWCISADRKLAKEYEEYMMIQEKEFYEYWKNILDPLSDEEKLSDFCPKFKQNE
ncbi:hypothetical protein H012_gp755 [Acanthamoeba polyphaga moumouvirus]|uniref:Uncharacterized protein n=1 Tax=Acanthamoeba polyphaga moumouvirus TaxID=1269028 RepID=L7RFS5_9VIRU|nr:hypothetical protein H012_gp755 [Acanthamoeba polyphaga moumouvirus]AGC01710.1 hypothetical protein Moumou_00166 [Acanthamoeba polyphaga moumouvirus]